MRSSVGDSRTDATRPSSPSDGLIRSLCNTVESARKASVLLVDDHEVVRAGLRSLLDLESSLHVVGEAGTAAEAVRRASLDAPDVVVLDARLPDRSGYDVCAEMKALRPGIRVVILTSFGGSRAVRAAKEAGAAAFEVKSIDAAALIDTIQRVAHGEVLLPADGPDGEWPPEGLTVREFDVARGVAAGQTNKEIADRLFLSETTVRNHVSRILLKLAMHNRSQLAAWMAEREAMRRVTDPLQTEGAS